MGRSRHAVKFLKYDLFPISSNECIHTYYEVVYIELVIVIIPLAAEGSRAYYVGSECNVNGEAMLG